MSAQDKLTLVEINRNICCSIIFWLKDLLNQTGSTQHQSATCQTLHIANTNLALSMSSSLSGFPRVTITPRFILAGSRAQFEMPTKATLFSRSMI